MSNKEQSVMRTEKDDATMLPRLRFPEFRDSGDWTVVPLGKIAEILSEKAGSRKLTLFSITSGVGLVSQIEKFGREIAGAQYKNYYVIHPNDFAYNKSATKDFPEGFIAYHQGAEPGAVPNSIFTCFRVDPGASYPPLLNYQFANNLHGKWLRRFITVGARAHGSLNVDDNDLLATPVPVPPHETRLAEQRKIADCLSSLDELIEAEEQKLKALKTNKMALVLELFPQKGEAVPRLRFPEFRCDPPWVPIKLSDVATIQSGGTPARTNPAYWVGDIPWVTTSLIDAGIILEAEEFITQAGLKESSAKVFPQGTLLMAMYGQGQTRGKVAILGIAAATNQACAAILLRSRDVSNDFLFQSLNGRYKEIREISNSGGQANLSAGLVANIPLSYPKSKDEQEKIASFLSSFDNLVRVQAQRVEHLRVCKKGLMQQLFPALNEVQE